MKRSVQSAARKALSMAKNIATLAILDSTRKKKKNKKPLQIFPANTIFEIYLDDL